MNKTDIVNYVLFKIVKHVNIKIDVKNALRNMI